MSIIRQSIVVIFFLQQIDGVFQRENLAVRHPCYSINKRLEPFITWTEKLASSQYQGPKDICLTRRSQPVCCTKEILDSYGNSLEIELKLLIDAELNRLSHVFLSTKQQIEDWIRDFLAESQRLTTTTLEILFGKQIFRLFIRTFLTNFFEIFSNSHSTSDDVSKSTNNLFDQLILSSYRRFFLRNSTIEFDQRFERCLKTKSSEFVVFPIQRDFLYTLTSSSVSFDIVRRTIVYLDADVERLKSSTNWSPKICSERFSRESLCPICSNSMLNETLCPNSCRFILKTCFNQSQNPFVAFASMAKSYAMILNEIENSIVELKFVERLGKFHIYLYDLIVNATRNSRYFQHLETNCPNSLPKISSTFRSFPPIPAERREFLFRSNRSLHFIYHQLKSSIENLHIRLSQQIISDVCSNEIYALKSNRCTQIDPKRPSSITFPIVESPINLRPTRDQLEDLRKKFSFIEQILLSLQPKKKYVLIEYLPDFDSYDNENDENQLNEQIPTIDDDQTIDFDGSLSEKLYKEIDGQTTTTTTTISSRSTSMSLNFLLCFLMCSILMRKF